MKKIVINYKLIIHTLLFGILSPGVLMTLPAGSSGSVFGEFETSENAVWAHSIMFFILQFAVNFILHTCFPITE